MNNVSFKLCVAFFGLASLRICAMGDELDFREDIKIGNPRCALKAPVSKYYNKFKEVFCADGFARKAKCNAPAAPVNSTKSDSDAAAPKTNSASNSVIPEKQSNNQTNSATAVTSDKGSSSVTTSNEPKDQNQKIPVRSSIIAKTLKFIASPYFLASAVIGSTLFYAYKKGYLAKIYKDIRFSIAEKLADRKLRQQLAEQKKA